MFAAVVLGALVVAVVLLVARARDLRLCRDAEALRRQIERAHESERRPSPDCEGCAALAAAYTADAEADDFALWEQEIARA